MNIPSLSDLVKKDQKVKFSWYRDGELWYTVEGTNFEFPVSGEDLKGAMFRAEDKAILFMRFIRKHIRYLEECLEQESD